MEQQKAGEEKGKKEEKQKKAVKNAKPKRLMRIANTDIDSNLRVRFALKRIKGIGFAVADSLCRQTGIDPGKRAEELTPDEIKSIEAFLQQPSMPEWMMNRRKDRETGGNIHLSGERIKLQRMTDINFLKSIRAYRGIRHETGLPVRGQKTRSGRGGKTVGVVKKAAKEAKAGGKT